MILRNNRAPRGIDLGPTPVPDAAVYRGTFVVSPSVPAKPAPPTPDPARSKGRFAIQPTDDPKIARRREVWRRCQQRRRERLAAAAKEGSNGV